MRSNNIYEASSVVKDVTDIIKDGLNKADSVVGSTSISRASSLSKATSGLNIVFPCLVSNTINPETAMMISRAVERKAVSLLQIAFSAFDITNSKDPIEYLRNFHTNLKGKISLDDFIDAMDTYATENNLIPKENLITFCEAKHLTPFPELMVNFIGTVHELKPDCVDNNEKYSDSEHIAPSLMMSGTFSKPTRRIQYSFEKRYYVNFFDNLFEDISVRLFLSKYGIEQIATLGKKCDKAPIFEDEK